MRIFFYLSFILAVVVAIFAVHNSQAPEVTMQFLIWQFETSLVYMILGSILAGVVLMLFLWIPKAARTSRRVKELNGEIRNLEAILHREVRYQSGSVKAEPVEAKIQRNEPLMHQHANG
jgi:uncharacterized integral membrane protein